MKRIHAIALAAVIIAGACNIDDANAAKPVAHGFAATLTCENNQSATFSQINNNNAIVVGNDVYASSQGTTRKAYSTGVVTFQWAEEIGRPNNLAAVALTNDWQIIRQLKLHSTKTGNDWVWCSVDDIQEF